MTFVEFLDQLTFGQFTVCVVIFLIVTVGITKLIFWPITSKLSDIETAINNLSKGGRNGPT